MTKRETLAPNPRLYAGPQALAGLKRRPRLSFLKGCAECVARQADAYLASPRCAPLANTHNAHLLRAKDAQRRVLTLLVRWLQTGEAHLRQAALDCVREAAGWEYWSWITWRQNDPRPDAIFDLSYGENSATLAFAFDWLRDTLSADERDLFLTAARERSLVPFLAHTDEPRQPRWYCVPHFNWNAVCAGGAGLLALAMHDELPEARRVLPRVEKSIDAFMRGLEQTGGGWTEGVGYWNFGMRYALLYLLSHERATGRAHPLLGLPETKTTLAFPTDFCPNGVSCGFGDANHWRPMPVHYAAARRLGRTDVMSVLEDQLAAAGPPEGGWPEAAEWLLVHAGRRAPAVKPERNVARLYDRMDWGILADRMPRPHVYLSVRGGTTKVSHGHRDLLSYHCVVGDEAMVTNLGIREYLDTTFSSRRNELFEVTPASKNVILINGVGIAMDAAVASRLVRGPGMAGVRMDATEAMGISRDDEPAAGFCGRLFLMLAGKAFLIVDRVVLPHDGRVESRAHTFASVDAQPAGALLIGERQRMRVTYACNVPATLRTAVTAPTYPDEPATVLRWCSDRLHTDVIMATLLCPGEADARVRIEPAGKGFVVAVAAKGLSRRIGLTARLGLARRRRS